MKSKKEIYQLKITLNNTSPPIWRRFLVQSNILLPDLHKIIQTVMGWTNSHLHQFIKNRQYFREPWENDYSDDSFDYADIKLDDFLYIIGDTCSYEYDFGDSWRHTIKLEKILPFDKNQNYPVCTAGKKNCPPEDCGGIYGFYNLLEIIRNPEHPDYEDMIDWIGEDYNSDYFDLNDVNKLLRMKDYGCFSMF